MDVADALRRVASHEETHYTRAVDALADLGSPVHAVAATSEEVHGGEPMVLGAAGEDAGSQVTGVAESARAGLQQQLDRHPLRTVFLAFGTGVLVGGAFRPPRR